MKYAIIAFGGKQLKVSEGDTFDIEKQGELIPSVLAYSDGKKLEVGTPVLSDMTVKLSKVEDKRDKKVRVARFKSKSRYHKVRGHRQPISVVKVEKIGKTVAKATPKAKVAKKE